MQFTRSRINTLGSNSEKASQATMGEREKERGTRTPCQQTNTGLTNESTQTYIKFVDIKACVCACVCMCMCM
jgi:hypothetical protein